MEISERMKQVAPSMTLAIDAKANPVRAPLISRADSRIKVYVIPTNEELMIARHTLALLSRPSLAKPNEAAE